MIRRPQAVFLTCLGIVAFRNIITHAYIRIDNRQVWQLATGALSKLLE